MCRSKGTIYHAEHHDMLQETHHPLEPAVAIRLDLCGDEYDT
jgi:hypothetical protein